MPSTLDDFQASFVQQNELASALYTSEYKRELLGKVNFLLDNVADQHKNTLIKSKIIAGKYQNFDLSKALNEGDSYFRKFFAGMPVIDLELLLLMLKPGLELNAPQDPQSSAVFDYVYKNKPMPSMEYKVTELVQALGNVFSHSLEAEAIRQHEKDLALNPGMPLAEHELQACGWMAPTFKLFLPKLGSTQAQANINDIIRRRILAEPKLSLSEKNRRLEFTAKSLADILEQRGLLQDAYELRESVFGSNYANQRSSEYKMSKDTLQKQTVRAAYRGTLRSFLRSLFRYGISDKYAKQRLDRNPGKASKVVPQINQYDLMSNPNLANRYNEVLKAQQQQRAIDLPRTNTLTPSFVDYRKQPSAELLLPQTLNQKFRPY